MTGVPSLIAAAVTDVGKVRAGNEDANCYDTDAGIAIVCDGMGGHQAGEVASALAVEMVRERWAGPDVSRARDTWLRTGTPQARRALFQELRAAVLSANQAIIDLSTQDRDKHGMGTTFTGIAFIGAEAMVSHAGDSRVYLVRDGNAVQVTDDHTLLARLAEAGVTTGPDATRWKGVVTNALGIGEPTWVASSAIPLATGDRLLLCSDGVSEYLADDEIGAVLSSLSSPARGARRLVELALERGGQDNATALVVKVVDVGDPAATLHARQRDDDALARCPLFSELTPRRRMRALRVATEHTIESGEVLPARFLGDRVAWIVLSGRCALAEQRARDGALLYGEALAGVEALPPAEWVARGQVRALALRVDDVAELTREEADVGEKLYAALAFIAGGRRPRRDTGETGEF
jgi:PPM family protein phosphatase